MKFGHVHYGMSSVITKHAASSLETMLIITPNPKYGMGVTPTTKRLSISLVLSHLFLWSTVNIVGIQPIVLVIMEVGCASRFNGTQNCNRWMEKGHSCWKPMMRWKCLPFLQLKYDIFKCQHLLLEQKLVPIFTNHVLGTIGESNTYFFLLPLTWHLMSLWQNQNLYSTSLLEHKSFFNPLHVGARVSCLPPHQSYVTMHWLGQYYELGQHTTHHNKY